MKKTNEEMAMLPVLLLVIVAFAVMLVVGWRTIHSDKPNKEIPARLHIGE